MAGGSYVARDYNLGYTKGVVLNSADASTQNTGENI